MVRRKDRLSTKIRRARNKDRDKFSFTWQVFCDNETAHEGQGSVEMVLTAPYEACDPDRFTCPMCGQEIQLSHDLIDFQSSRILTAQEARIVLGAFDILTRGRE